MTLPKNEFNVNHRKTTMKKVKLTAFIFFAFLIMYVPSFIHWVSEDEAMMDMIRYGSIEESFSQEAMLIRDETVLASPVEGTYIPQSNEGDMVQANSVISVIVKQEIEDLFLKKNQLQQKLLAIQKNRTETRELFSGDLLRIDEEINHIVFKIIQSSNHGLLSNYQTYRNDLDTLIEKKATIVSNSSIKNESTMQLERDIKQLESLINANQAKVISKHSGIVSYWIDGYEDILNSNMIENLSLDTYQSIKNKMVFTGKEDTSVQSGMPFVKVIFNSDYYIVLLTDSKTASKIKLNERVSIRINENGVKLPATLDYKSKVVQDKVFLSFKSDRLLSSLVGLRKVHVDIIQNNYSGLKVPITSLFNFNRNTMKASIMIMKLRTAKQIDVNVVGYNTEFAIIENREVTSSGINLYDTYFIDSKDVKEGQIFK